MTTRFPRKSRQRRFSLLLICNLLLILSLACSLPGLFEREKQTPQGTPAPTSGPTAPPALPTPTPQPLPPALVESSPPPGAELPLDGEVTLFFNQPMQRESVEEALSVQPGGAGTFEWADDATLSFRPGSPLQPESQVGISLAETARSQGGLSLTQPLSLTYQTTGYLRLAQALPEPGGHGIDPTSAVVAAFNRPVVALGADPAGLPAAFTLQVEGQPEAGGQGEWLNTSTYIYYPDPALQGGKTYTVSLNPELKGAGGSPLLVETESWSFNTANPRVLSVAPDSAQSSVRLDTDFTLTFNQPMDPTSVEAHFSLVDAAGSSTPGQFSWNEDFTVLTFNPIELLSRDSLYRLLLNGSARASGGTELGSSVDAGFHTYPSLRVTGSNPAEGGIKAQHGGLQIHFNAPLPLEGHEQYLTLTPEVPNLSTYWNEYISALVVTGDFDPSTGYSLRISPDLADVWGAPLGSEFILNFTTSPLEPSLFFSSFSDLFYLTGRDTALPVQASNLEEVGLSIGSVPLGDFLRLFGPDSYELRSVYMPDSPTRWIQPLSLAADRIQTVELPLDPGGGPLAPGLYLLRFETPFQNIQPGPYLLVVSDLHLTFKIGAADALVWAVDLQTGQPAAGVPVALYTEDGSSLASGQTDDQGVFQASIPAQTDPYQTFFAVTGQPGEPGFSLALSTWSNGITSWDFGIPAGDAGPGIKAYLYSDRPIYRPGQTIYFRAAVRQAFNGRYTLPDLSSYPLILYDGNGQEVARFDLPLSAFGTGHGEYTLSAEAQPGEYRLAPLDGDFSDSIQLKVAEYRKPEIDLQVSFPVEQALSGESLTAGVEARYFFDAPAGNLPLRWALYSAPEHFFLPGFQVSVEDTSWLAAFRFPPLDPGLGQFIQEGEAETAPDGSIAIELPPLPEQDAPAGRRRLTLEVTAADESGQPVSARASVILNPGEYHVGLHPEAWSGRAGEPSGLDVQVVDWQSQPAGERALRAEFSKVEWVEDESGRAEFGPSFVPQYTPEGSTDFSTNAEGHARISFVPSQPGVYQVAVYGLQDGAPAEPGPRTEVLLWIGGPGQVVWPAIPNQRLRLTADREGYAPGETAEIFIPNPLGVAAQALVTVERGAVLRYRTVSIDATGSSLSLPIEEGDAPNVYLSVTLLKPWEGGRPDFRQGYLELPVETTALSLNLDLQASTLRTGPGDEVTFDLQVTDAAGEPVEGEFSFSVVDRAVLALADPNAPDILPAFYGPQPLGVRTGLSLAAYGYRDLHSPPGMGGGGGGEFSIPVVREEFPDTAFWEARLVTDADGRARVTVPIPDSLTTWQVEVRGLSADTRVGQAQLDLVTTKDLLVRPVTPRFFVQGDHVLVAAVVQNNTAEELQVQVSLSAGGFTPDNPAGLQVPGSIPAGGRTRVEWWGTVEAVDYVDLVFSAVSGDLQDAARPALGRLPVLQFTAPQTFRTSGFLSAEQLQVQELVSLPRLARQGAASGELQIELAPSLAASLLSSLEALEHYPYECTEQTLSRFLPNLEAYRALQGLGIEAADLQRRLERTLDEGLGRLAARQNEDGGWGWWAGDESDPYLSAYVLFGLTRAAEAGVNFEEERLLRAVEFIRAALPGVEMLQEDWQLDRLAFELFALAEAGASQPQLALELFEARGRLSPWAQAFLALALRSAGPDSGGATAADTLLSDLQAGALRSATGAHWESGSAIQNMVSPVTATAIVVYALAREDPASTLLADAVRYLTAHRGAGGMWDSTYSTAWSVLALVQTMQGTGELGGEYAFAASLNEAGLAQGQASATLLNPVTASAPLSGLYPDYPNLLSIERGPGAGRLYYTAGLQVALPVQAAAPINRGLSLERRYTPEGQPRSEALSEGRAGERVQVRLTLTLPEDMYHLVVEDWIPAGAEILDLSLKTSQQGDPTQGLPVDEAAPEEPGLFEPANPFAEGWGWWLFDRPQIYDDHIAWAAGFAPAGVYELTYTLVLLQPGAYNVIPARAWQFYFPEVQGSSAGSLFAINP